MTVLHLLQEGNWKGRACGRRGAATDNKALVTCRNCIKTVWFTRDEHHAVVRADSREGSGAPPEPFMNSFVEALSVVPNATSFQRVSGEHLCDECGKPVYDHLLVRVAETGGPLLLRKSCAGEYWKT